MRADAILAALVIAMSAWYAAPYIVTKDCCSSRVTPLQGFDPSSADVNKHQQRTQTTNMCSDQIVDKVHFNSGNGILTDIAPLGTGSLTDLRYVQQLQISRCVTKAAAIPPLLPSPNIDSLVRSLSAELGMLRQRVERLENANSCAKFEVIDKACVMTLTNNLLENVIINATAI